MTVRLRLTKQERYKLNLLFKIHVQDAQIPSATHIFSERLVRPLDYKKKNILVCCLTSHCEQNTDKLLEFSTEIAIHS